MKEIRIAAVVASLFLLIACVRPVQGIDDSRLLPGNSEIVLQEGLTTKEQVARQLGAPDIVTEDREGNEVWTYSEHASVSDMHRSGNFFTIILAGAHSSTRVSRQGQRTVTLMVTFKDNVVDNVQTKNTAFLI